MKVHVQVWCLRHRYRSSKSSNTNCIELIEIWFRKEWAPLSRGKHSASTCCVTEILVRKSLQAMRLRHGLTEARFLWHKQRRRNELTQLCRFLQVIPLIASFPISMRLLGISFVRGLLHQAMPSPSALSSPCHDWPHYGYEDPYYQPMQSMRRG